MTTDLVFPVWDPKKNKARPKLWVEKFKRFVRFQNDGAEPEPYAEIQLLIHAVPETSLTARTQNCHEAAGSGNSALREE